MNSDLISEFLIDTSSKAGDIIKSYFGKTKSRTIKTSVNDFATEGDYASEAFIIEQIKKYFPDDLIVSEETNATTDLHHKDRNYWVIDPIDGTYNFANYNPDCGLLLSYVEKDSPSCCVIYNPFSEERIHVSRTQGVFFNDLKITPIIDNHKQVITVGKPHIIEKVSKKFPTACLYSMVSDALSFIKEERIGAVYDRNGPSVWDYVPVYILFEQYGLTVSDIDGNPYNWKFADGMVAGTQTVHNQLMHIVRG